MGFDQNPVYTFDTAEGKAISDLLTDYAMGLLREMGLNPDGSRRVRARDRAAAAAAGEKAATAAVVPTRSAMAASDAVYGSVGGEAGNFASAATRSGEYVDSVPGAGAHVGAGAPPPPPPPPPSFSAPPPPPPPPAATTAVPQHAHAPATAHVHHAPPPSEATAPAEPPLPPNWTVERDTDSGDIYYFNAVTGVAVWDRSEVV